MPRKPDSSRRDKKRVEPQERSTTPEGDPPRRGSWDFATGHRTSGIQSQSRDYASGYGLPEASESEFDLTAELALLREEGLGDGKFRVLEPPDEKFHCDSNTFFNGRAEVGDPRLTREKVRGYVNSFEKLGSKNRFSRDPSLYDRLDKKLKKNPDQAIAVYRKDSRNPIVNKLLPDRRYTLHTSPIESVYQDEEGNHRIKLWGKWGSGALGSHDIEDVSDAYKNGDKIDWEVRVTDREKGRIMDR